LYLGLTVILIIALILAGMAPFDAICNAMSTMSAGGFSPNGQSIMGYNIPAVTWLIGIFMIIAGTSFNLQYKVLQSKNPLNLFKDDEFKLYFGFIVVMTIVIAEFLMLQHNYDFVGAIRHSMFQVVSVMTSSGFASVDYTKWTYSAQVLLVIAMFFSSCASSAGGGIKIARLLLIFKIMKNEIEKILHPNAVIPVKHNGNLVPQDVLRQVIIFVFQYFMILAVTAIILTILEQNHTLGLTSAITSLGNIGPAFGQIGPMESFESMHALSKIILIFNMLVGRLELIPFVVMLNPEFWSIKAD
jgi:trk system potassium uptake protein TrkH